MRLLFLFLIFLSTTTWAKDQFQPEVDVVLKDESDVERFQCILSPEYTTMSNAGNSLFGIGVQGAFLVAIGENWQGGLGFRQSFSGSGVSTLFTEIDLRGSYVITGSNNMARRQVSINDEVVVQGTSYGEGGLRLDFYIPQYFFNLENSVLPLSGFGTGIHYEFPSSSGFGVITGVRIDYVTSGSLAIYPLQFFAGINFWL